MPATRNGGLNPKQIRFCEEYLIDSNATQSAIRANYSLKTSGVIGYENLKKPQIRAYIDQLKEKQSKRTEITSDRILKELAKMAFFNVEDTLDEFGDIKPLEDWSRDDLAAVQEVTTTKYFNEVQSVKVKTSGKERSLELLGKHKKLFTDKLDVTGDMQVTFNLDYGDKPQDAG